jgi:hypothetical protein
MAREWYCSILKNEPIRRLANYTPALVPSELLLQIGLSVKSLRQGGQWNFEQFVALLAYSDGWSGI